MEQILSFLSDLILLTAGLVVAGLWIVIIIFVAVEVYDLIFEKKQDEEE